ncbi:MAG TPA: hypothetical protein ENI62_07880, partial [Gammaproteobacteria bacterium]|nr:hypothetical protein [Gammaproteobacteria bacterium]
QGVALIISMILLAVITLLSVTAMRGTNLDARIAANYQHKQLSFQAAENVFAKLTGPNDQVVLPTAYSGMIRTTNYVSFPGIVGQPAMKGDLELTYVGTSAPGEYKFSGYSLGNVVAVIYQADSFGSISNSNARSHHRATVALIRDR